MPSEVASDNCARSVERKLSATPGETRWLGPTLGEHTAEVLTALGFGKKELDALKDQGLV